MSGFYASKLVHISPSRYEVRAADGSDKVLGVIQFQDGPVKEYGMNGLQVGDLLNICRHQLNFFQQGPYKTEYNARAIAHITQALEELDARTARRLEQGIEGTSQVGIE